MMAIPWTAWVVCTVIECRLQTHSKISNPIQCDVTGAGNPLNAKYNVKCKQAVGGVSTPSTLVYIFTPYFIIIPS